MAKRLLDVETKVFHSSQTENALRYEWGSFLKVLMECLVDGTAVRPVTSITKHSIPLEDDSYWFYKVELSRKHNYWSERSVVAFKGCTNPLFNVEFRVQETEETSFVIAFDKTIQTEDPGDPGVLPETVEHLPPIGYEVAFQTEGVKVFKAKSKTNSPWYWRVEDQSTPETPTRNNINIGIAMCTLATDMQNVNDIYLRAGRKTIPSYLSNTGKQVFQIHYINTDGSGSNTFENYIIVGDDRTLAGSFYKNANIHSQEHGNGFLLGEYVDFLGLVKPYNIMNLNKFEHISSVNPGTFYRCMDIKRDLSFSPHLDLNKVSVVSNMLADSYGGIVFSHQYIKENEKPIGKLRILREARWNVGGRVNIGLQKGTLIKNTVDEEGKEVNDYLIPLGFEYTTNRNYYILASLRDEV